MQRAIEEGLKCAPMLKWISQLGAKTFCHIKDHGPREEHYQKQATYGVQTLALLILHIAIAL